VCVCSRLDMQSHAGSSNVGYFMRSLKVAFHNTDIDTDILARILADTSDTRPCEDVGVVECGLNGATVTYLRTT